MSAAKVVTEALASALAKTETAATWKDQFVTVDDNGRAFYSGEDGADFVRRDVMDAALAHLATRAAEAEGRAERAEDLQRRTEQMWRAASDSADEWRNRCESSSKRGRDMMAALDRAEAAETALGRIVRDHWIEVAKKEVRSMEFDLERLYMMPAKPYGRIDRSARAQQARLQKIESDKRDRKELPRLIAQTKAAIESAGKEAPRG